MYKQVKKYFASHVMFNSLVHFLIGLGVGILIARPVIGEHPLRWGIALIIIGLALHLYPLTSKK